MSLASNFDHFLFSFQAYFLNYPLTVIYLILFTQHCFVFNIHNYLFPLESTKMMYIFIKTIILFISNIWSFNFKQKKHLQIIAVMINRLMITRRYLLIFFIIYYPAKNIFTIKLQLLYFLIFFKLMFIFCSMLLDCCDSNYQELMIIFINFEKQQRILNLTFICFILFI